jgi:hypothetical protein
MKQANIMKLIVNNFHLIFIVLSTKKVKGFTMVKVSDKKKLLKKFKNITTKVQSGLLSKIDLQSVYEDRPVI